jgi:Family of unknown function (DUF6390)
VRASGHTGCDCKVTRSVPGPVAFARFAYPPNALGYCGPPHPELLLGAASEGALRELTDLASRFDGAWAFLELIASSNGIDDPLDPRVVDAYWIGNSLLERVPRADLAQQLESRFERRTGNDLASVTHAALLGGAAHHSFQVFAVYPWLALLRAGNEGTALHVLDRCRIRWGTVLSVNGDEVTVRDRALGFRRRLLVEGPDRIEDARRSLDGVGFTEDLVPGDAVALHWDWVCQRLSAAAVRRLRLWTNRMFDVVNAFDS